MNESLSHWFTHWFSTNWFLTQGLASDSSYGLVSYGFAFVAGALLGVFFFAGLWWTVRKLQSTKAVGLFFLGSMLIRTSVVVLGFYFILGDDWQRLVAGLIGFTVARLTVTRLTRTAQSKHIISTDQS